MSRTKITSNQLNTTAASNFIATPQTTTSTSYTDLATVGPSCTVTIGANGLALLCVTIDGYNSGASYAIAAYSASGANTISNTQCFALVQSEVQSSYVILLTGLTAGSTTFKVQYKVTGGTGTFQNRGISVVPL